MNCPKCDKSLFFEKERISMLFKLLRIGLSIHTLSCIYGVSRNNIKAIAICEHDKGWYQVFTKVNNSIKQKTHRIVFGIDFREIGIS